MTIAIREMRLGDRLTVEKLLDAMKPGWRNGSGSASTGTITFLGDSGTFCFAAFDDDEPVGWAWGDRLRHPDGMVTAYLRGLEVADDARREGVGTLLLDACLHHARSQGHDRFEALVEPDNTAARALLALAVDAGAPGGVESEALVYRWKLA